MCALYLSSQRSIALGVDVNTFLQQCKSGGAIHRVCFVPQTHLRSQQTAKNGNSSGRDQNCTCLPHSKPAQTGICKTLLQATSDTCHILVGSKTHDDWNFLFYVKAIEYLASSVSFLDVMTWRSKKPESKTSQGHGNGRMRCVFAVIILRSALHRHHQGYPGNRAHLSCSYG